MEIAGAIRCEWHDDRRLCAASCAWLVAHAEPGDVHPVVTAVAQLRAEG